MIKLENTVCVVCASREDIIQDVKTSLGLLKMEVHGALSIAGAKAQLLSGKEPVLALVEHDFPGKLGEGLQLAKGIKSHPTLSHIPVCALIEGYAVGDPIPAGYDGVFPLPVEFPSFTHEVKKFFESFDGQVVSIDREEPVEDLGEDDAVKEDSEPAGVPEVTFRHRTGRLMDRRLVVAYGIQLAVLDELERSQEFKDSSIEAMPGVIARITEKVAGEFDLTDLLGAKYPES